MKKNLKKICRDIEEDSREGQTRRRRTCERLHSELKHHMIHELCWADQENDLIQKMLGLMMNINAMLREALRERSLPHSFTQNMDFTQCPVTSKE